MHAVVAQGVADTERWPMVGRAGELGVAVTAIDRAGRRAGVIVAGDAGVGRTRLALEVLEAASGRGATTRWAVATAAARKVPLGPFVHMMSIGSAPATHTAFEQLLSAAGQAGMVLGIDDAHLLDDRSAAFVHGIATRRAARLVVTMRTGVPAPDAITALWKDDLLTRLDLAALSPDDVTELLVAVLGGPVESHTAARLWEVTAGNAQYLRHLVETERAAGRLAPTLGVWRWQGEVVEPAASLMELVAVRMGPLSAPARHVLELVALAEQLDVGLLDGLVEPAAWEEVEQRQLVHVAAGSDGRLRARLTVPLHGHVLRSSMQSLRARRLRGLLASTAPDGDIIVRARLLLDSDMAPDPGLIAAAAAEALRRGELSLAERLARAGVGADAALTLGKALAGRGRPGATEALANAEAAATGAQRIDAAVTAATHLFGIGRPREAETALRRVAGEDEAAAAGAMFALLAGRPLEAERTARRIADRGAPMGGRTAAALVGALGSLGRVEEVRAVLPVALDAAERSPDAAHLRPMIWFGHVHALRQAGLITEAEDAARRYRAAAGSVPVLREKGTLIEAVVALDRGDLRSTMDLLREAAAGLHGNDADNWLFRASVTAATAHGMAGDAKAAQAALAQARARYGPTVALFAPELELAAAWVAASEGVHSEAVAAAHQAASLARGSGRPAAEVEALQTAVRFGARDVAGRLAELACRVEGLRGRLAARHGAALAAGDGELLDEVAVRWRELGALLLAADAAAQAAEVYQRAGLKGSAHAATGRAVRWARSCGPARTPALLANARRLPITARELEIAALVAAGLSNLEIAERLVVSVRTVEGHIYRACTKLDVSDRSALGTLVRQAEAS
jgi:DNA-binding CsgD family transcriptional regulator